MRPIGSAPRDCARGGVAHRHPHHLSRSEAAQARTHKRGFRHRDHVVIFIDEAQNPSIECIEFLRWLHEEHPGRFALALIGGVQLHGRLSRSPQLMRRVFARSRGQRQLLALTDGPIRSWER